MATEQSCGMGSLGRALSLSLHFPGSCGLPELAQPSWESKVYAEPSWASSPACCTAEGAVGRSPDASEHSLQRLGSALKPSRGTVKNRQTQPLPPRGLAEPYAENKMGELAVLLERLEKKAQSQALKSCWFNSQLGYMPWLQV